MREIRKNAKLTISSTDAQAREAKNQGKELRQRISNKCWVEYQGTTMVAEWLVSRQTSVIYLAQATKGEPSKDSEGVHNLAIVEGV